MALRFFTGLLSVLFAACLLMTSAWAHHGWNWADSEQIKLTGTVKSVSMVPPHPRLEVETPNDGVWRIELANPAQTKRAGFIEGSAKPGDSVNVTGNRSKDHTEKRMKAVQITVGDKAYDIYPDRISAGR
ncbi:DUF6152 family protein [Pollutimonas thiosulfatoxidans]|uniref:DUF5666 domain-containing protein n=1 Tax=Pollutimonas thiosulfatoxidans TaxID=2028345 RepID=A0A410GC59_9BURK|nr:DUF6152 family protein [Pollutimonas thiosulfatoxidans]MBF6617122.1 hypothetical protein [Candidimonas sp.]QAA93864.1 hypothetical protein CKA81_08450 [Pollutimonas thiosulfatoxidans]